MIETIDTIRAQYEQTKREYLDLVVPKAFRAADLAYAQANGTKQTKPFDVWRKTAPTVRQGVK